MRTINIHEAKTHLSRLVEEVSAGEEVAIAKAGKPLARLVPLRAKRERRKLGVLAPARLLTVDDVLCQYSELVELMT